MKRKKGTITALLVVYNEEKVIERCLKSLVSCVDEIILIHDGPCDDKTLEIAKRYTKKVFVGERRGMCELHFIDGLKKVKTEWVLRIDADEYLEKKLQGDLHTLIKSDDIDVFSFIWKMWDGKQYITENFPWKKTLYRMSKLFFFEFPHREFESTGKEKQANYVLEHKPLYNNFTMDKLLTKWRRWSEIHAKYYLKDEYNSFQTNEVCRMNFQKEIDMHVKYSNLIFCPGWFFYSVLKSLFYREFFKNIKTWKVALFQGFYGLYLCYYISKYKRKKK